MPYSAEHTRQTRERILSEAARAFRRFGFHGAKIGDIMRAAKLTHGGFYAHFDSKEELFANVLMRELELGLQVERAAAASAEAPAEAAMTAIDYYLAPEHAARIAHGCTMVANAGDIARASLGARSAFTHAFASLADVFTELVAERHADAESRALAAVSTCVGAVTLAHAVTDRSLAERMLEGARNSVLRELGVEQAR